MSSQASSETTDAVGKQQTKDVTSFKIVIRRLPPYLTEEEVKHQLAPLPDYDYFSFVPADMSWNPWAYSRVYINFTKIEDILMFRDRFDGYVFVDAKGNEQMAIVELAPCQKVPKKRKKDPKCGTIEQDPEYQQFLESLKNPNPSHLPTLEACLEEIEKRTKERKDQEAGIVKTPLVEFIKWRKEEKARRREERKRQEEEKRKQREEEKRKRIEEERERRRREQARARQQEEKRREREKELARQSRESEKTSATNGDATEKPKERAKHGPPRRSQQEHREDKPSRGSFDSSHDFTDHQRKSKGSAGAQKPQSRGYHREERAPRFEAAAKASPRKEQDDTYDDASASVKHVETPQRRPTEERQSSDIRESFRRDQHTEGTSEERNERKKRPRERPAMPLYQPGQRKKAGEHVE